MKGEHFFLNTLFKCLKESGVNYCVLRNYSDLPVSTGKSDLDILVVKKHVNKFYDILNQVLLRSNAVIIAKYGKLSPRVCVLGIYNKLSFGVQLDVHEGVLPYKVSNIFPVDFIFERSFNFNGVQVARQNDASVLAFFKEIYHNKYCKEKYFNEASIIWKKEVELYRKALGSILNSSLIDDLDILLSKTYNEALIKDFAIKATKYFKKSPYVKMLILNNALNKLYRFFNPPGFTIAVLGTDGAGKTTIINSITKPLSKSVHKSVFYEHMRPNLIPNIANLFGKKKTNDVVSEPHSGKQSSFLVSLIRLFYYTFDYTVGYWLKVYPVKVKKACIWIFDRYYYDYLIDQKRGNIKLPIWLVKAIGFFVPKPKIILCLGAEPSIIHERKPELPLEEVERQVKELKAFCKRNKKAVWIDTGLSINESTNAAIEAVISNIK